jgi:hypothetical protein
MQEVVELQVQLARLNAKLDEAENARRVLDTARRDLEKDINIKVELIAHARWTFFFWKIIKKDINIKIWCAQDECSCATGSGHGQEGPREKDINIKVLIIAHALMTLKIKVYNAHARTL